LILYYIIDIISLKDGEGRGWEGEKVSLITTSQLRWDVVKNTT
jgi:hypothetical protein